MDLAQLLASASSPDDATRNQAEQLLKQAEETQFFPFVAQLSVELANEQLPPTHRQLAGLQLKNMLKAESADLQLMKSQRWNAGVDPAAMQCKEQIRAQLLQSLCSVEREVRRAAAIAIGALAVEDVPKQQWPSLLPSFYQLVTGAEFSEGTKEATLEACGYMCEELDEDALDSSQSNQILTSIVDGIQPTRPESTRKAAVRALNNALVFCRKNFDRDEERHMIMDVVVKACGAADSETRVNAYQCISRIAGLYYDKLAPYIDHIYTISTQAIQNDEEDVGKMALDFWGTVCEVEFELSEIQGQAAQPQCFNFIQQAMGPLVSILLQVMTRQDEDGEDLWDLPNAAAHCLELIANTVRDAVLDPARCEVLTFVQNNIHNPDWHFREAAITAFSMILEGPNYESLQTIVEQAMEILITALADPHVLVKDAAGWACARIAELVPGAIPQQLLNVLITRLHAALDDQPRVAEKACTCIQKLAASMHEQSAQGKDWIQQYFGPLLEKLLATQARPDGLEFNLRVVAHEAFNELVRTSPDSCVAVVAQARHHMQARLDQTFAMQILSHDDRTNQDCLQALIIGSLNVMYRRLDKAEILPYCDALMQSLLNVLMTKQSAASEEAFLAIGVLITHLETDFERYLAHLMPLLVDGLNNWQEYRICNNAVGVVADMCNNLDDAQIAPLEDQIMTCLMNALQNGQLHRSVKPTLLSTLGDVAFAISGRYVKFLPASMSMLGSAAEATVPEQDDELVEYLQKLREGIMNGYIGVINGLSFAGGQQQLLAPTNYVQQIAAFLQKIADDPSNDEVLLRGSVGIVGDLAKNMGPAVAPYLQHRFVQVLFEKCIQYGDDEHGTMNFARQHVQNLNQPMVPKPY